MSGNLIKVTVKNTTDRRIGRAGKVFQPNSIITTLITEYGYAEMKACRGLQVKVVKEKEPQLRLHTCELCGFVAKTEAGLKSHQRSHEGGE